MAEELVTNSILNSVKPKLNIEKSETAFDEDQLIDYINSVFFDLCQIRVGPSRPFMITGQNETWDDFFGERTDLQPVKTYVAMKVRRMFDPPSSSAALQTLVEQIKEMEWRLNVYVDPTEEELEALGFGNDDGSSDDDA